MHIVSGIDIVNIQDFEANLQLAKQTFLARCFSETESQNKNRASLAGMFAAKEAVIKALDLKPGSWLDIEITKKPTGKPQATIHNSPVTIASADLSISHTDQIACAIFIALIQ